MALLSFDTTKYKWFSSLASNGYKIDFSDPLGWREKQNVSNDAQKCGSLTLVEKAEQLYRCSVRDAKLRKLIDSDKVTSNRSVIELLCLPSYQLLAMSLGLMDSYVEYVGN